jgi:serine/threonine protein kinase
MIAFGVLQALLVLHARSVTHGDLSPDNILISPDYRPRLTSFALHRIAAAVTKPLLRGHFQFTAPELYSGATRCEATDIFSFGMVLYSIFADSLPSPTIFDQLVIPHKIIAGEPPQFLASSKRSSSGAGNRTRPVDPPFWL